MAKQHDLGGKDAEVFIGEDITLRVQLVKLNSSNVEVVEGDISGNAYTFTLKGSPKDASAIFTKATGGSGITFANGDTAAWPVELSGSNTVAVIAIADTDTDGFTVGEYDWDLRRTDAGSEAVVAWGTLKFSKPIG